MICPNCGGEASTSLCPYCGARLDIAPKEKDRKFDAGFDSDCDQRYGNPNYNDYRWLVQDHPMKDSKVEIIGNSPVGQFLRGLANSAAMLGCALLATLYAGVVCYSYGVSIFQSLDHIAANSFDSYFSLGKISSVAYVAVSVGHVCLSVWLAVALWSFFFSGTGRKPGMPTQSLNGLRGFVKACVWVYKLLTAVGVICLLYLVLLRFAGEDLFEAVKPARTFFDFIAQLTSFAAVQTGLERIAAVISDEAIVCAAVFCAASVMRLFLFVKLQSVTVSAVSMIRFGEVTQRRVSHVVPLTLLSGLLVIVNGVLAFLSFRLSGAVMLEYGPFLISGLSSVLMAGVLNRYFVGVRRMQNGEPPENTLF